MFRVASFEVQDSSPPILTRTDPLQNDEFPPLNHGTTLEMGISSLGGYSQGRGSLNIVIQTLIS